MKITFMHEGGIQEFTPPDFATSVVIKTRPNGVSIDYESSTVDAVKEFFGKLPDDLGERAAKVYKEAKWNPVKQPVLHRGKKGVGWKLTDKDRDAIVKAWTKEKPTPTYKALGARYGIHGSTVSDIIHQAMKNPVTIRPAKKKAFKQTKSWDRRPLADDVKQKVLKIYEDTKRTATSIADELGISQTSVKRILNGQETKGRKKKITPFIEEEIVRMVNDGAITRQAIADRLKINISTVSRVLAKKRSENYNKELDMPTV